MNLTPSTKGSFIAGVGLWCLIWASLFKADEIAQAGGFQRWVSSERCLRWIRQHKSTSLISTEILNYSHTGLDPLGVPVCPYPCAQSWVAGKQSQGMFPRAVCKSSCVG